MCLRVFVHVPALTVMCLRNVSSSAGGKVRAPARTQCIFPLSHRTKNSKAAATAPWGVLERSLDGMLLREAIHVIQFHKSWESNTGVSWMDDDMWFHDVDNLKCLCNMVDFPASYVKWLERMFVGISFLKSKTLRQSDSWPSHWESLGFQIVPTRINKGRTHLIPHVFWTLPWNFKLSLEEYLSWRLWSGFCFPNDNFVLSLFISWSYPVISRSNVFAWLIQSTHFACGEYCCSSLWYIQQNYLLKKKDYPSLKPSQFYINSFHFSLILS